VPIIRGINCINTTSGRCHSVYMTVWCAGLDETEQYHPILIVMNIYSHCMFMYDYPD
jgi:hypothetical protein